MPSEIRKLKMWQHGTAGAFNESVPHIICSPEESCMLAGKNTGVSMSWLGNCVIDRGFAWELLTFSSISTRAGCRSSED